MPSRSREVLRKVREVATRVKGAMPKNAPVPVDPKTQPTNATDPVTPTMPTAPPLHAETEAV